MSGLTKEQKDEMQRAIEAYRNSGGEIHRGPRHAPATGQIRYNFAAQAKKEAEQKGAENRHG